MRAIDADELIEELKQCLQKCADSEQMDDVMEQIERVHKQPTIDAEPVRHGHWIERDGFDGDAYYDCSACGHSWVTIEGTPQDNEMNYCPYCGAHMDEVTT